MGKALGLFLIVVASGLLIYWVIAPGFAPRAVGPAPAPEAANPLGAQSASVDGASAIASASSSPSTGQTAPSAPTAPPVTPPRSPEQQAQDNLEAKRAPYYRWLRDQAGDRITDVRLADDDRSALVLYTSVDSPDVVAELVRDVVAPEAYGYGFRKIRFFVPNPAGNVSQYRYDAESTSDADGNWHTFLK